MEKFKELFRYGFFGIITTGINLVLLAVFVKLGMYYILANTVAYIFAVIVNYVFNQRFVFAQAAKSGTPEARRQFIKFILLRVVSLVIDNALFYLLVTILALPMYPSRIGLTIAIIMITFIINKLFVFSKDNGGKDA